LGAYCHVNQTPRTERSSPRAIARSDAEYPALLAAVPDAPAELHVRGGLEAADALAVAIVGSRHATPYGEEVAERLAADLAARGVTVVSGLARGIDTAAHRGALRVGGRTLAVLGSGLDVIYPRENRALAAAIALSGAVVSQFPPSTPPLAYHFPLRNRVLAGLALAVVVVEAAERSGALITAALAGELGREVMAVPGRVTSPASRGCHRLLRDGAVLVESWEDVVGALAEPWRRMVAAAPAVAAPAAAGAGTRALGAERAPELDRVLRAMGEEPLDVDAVSGRAGLPTGQAAALLLALELDGRVRQLAGARFVRAVGA